MKIYLSIVFFVLYTAVVKAQEKVLISETDSIKLFETYVSMRSSENIFPTFYNKGFIYASNHNSKYYNIYYSGLQSSSLIIKMGSRFVLGPVAIFDKEIYFTRYSNRTSSTGNLNVTIYKGKFENSKVSKVEKLPICNKEYAYSHPAISKDGNFMVIVTNERGEFHLLELNRNSQGIWEKGAVIFIAQPNIELLNPTIYDENTIYFSSNSFSTDVKRVENMYEKNVLVYSKIYREQGDFDIYKITKENGKWILPLKVPALNSEFDDSGVIFKTATSGYLTTYRFNDTDNIYYFELK